MGKLKFAVGAGIAALIAAGAAVFFTQTKTGKTAAKKIKLEAVELGKKVALRMQNLKKVSQDKYNEIVDEVVDDYAKSKKIAKTQSRAIKKDLKGHWYEVKKELKKKPAKSKK